MLWGLPEGCVVMTVIQPVTHWAENIITPLYDTVTDTKMGDRTQPFSEPVEENNAAHIAPFSLTYCEYLKPTHKAGALLNIKNS